MTNPKTTPPNIVRIRIAYKISCDSNPSAESINPVIDLGLHRSGKIAVALSALHIVFKLFLCTSNSSIDLSTSCWSYTKKTVLKVRTVQYADDSLVYLTFNYHESRLRIC